MGGRGTKLWAKLLGGVGLSGSGCWTSDRLAAFLQDVQELHSLRLLLTAYRLCMLCSSNAYGKPGENFCVLLAYRADLLFSSPQSSQGCQVLWRTCWFILCKQILCQQLLLPEPLSSSTIHTRLGFLGVTGTARECRDAAAWGSSRCFQRPWSCLICKWHLCAVTITKGIIEWSAEWRRSLIGSPNQTHRHLLSLSGCAFPFLFVGPYSWWGCWNCPALNEPFRSCQEHC